MHVNNFAPQRKVRDNKNTIETIDTVLHYTIRTGLPFCFAKSCNILELHLLKNHIPQVNYKNV